MLGLLWVGVPSDATKKFSRLLCRSLPFFSKTIKIWLGTRRIRRSHSIFVTRTVGSMTCLRNLE